MITVTMFDFTVHEKGMLILDSSQRIIKLSQFIVNRIQVLGYKESINKTYALVIIYQLLNESRSHWR